MMDAINTHICVTLYTSGFKEYFDNRIEYTCIRPRQSTYIYIYPLGMPHHIYMWWGIPNGYIYKLTDVGEYKCIRYGYQSIP